MVRKCRLLKYWMQVHMKSLFESIVLFWFVLVRPSAWISNYKTCMKWDAELRKLIKEGAPIYPVKYSERRIQLGDHQIWVSNFPYAYGSTVNRLSNGTMNIKKDDVLPTVRTRYMLRAYIKNKMR